MFLGLDLGTSSLKAMLWSPEAHQTTRTVALKTCAPFSGWSEQSPEDWWQAVIAAMAQLAQTQPLDGVKAIGLSGQMHGLVALDANNQVLRPAILWNDNRSLAEAAAAGQTYPWIGRRAGVPPLPGFTAPKLPWLKQHEPSVYDRIAHILLPKDYIGLRLHGGLSTDPSDAAGTLLFDQAARVWSPELCAAFDVNPDWLPPVYDGAHGAGRLTPSAAAALGLPRGIPVVAGAGDTAAGAVAIGATEPGRGFISLGTSGQLFVAGDRYAPNPDRFVHAYAHTLPDRWFQMAAMLNGARPLSWFAGVLGVEVATLLEEAARADPTRVPLFLPYLTGERSPHGDPLIRGGFFGLDDATDRAAMCRAVVEAIAFSFADAVESFGQTITTLPHLLAIGGGARSDLLLRMIADVTGQRLARGAGAEAGPALGAAELAAFGTGGLSAAEMSAEPHITDWFEPNPQPVLAERLVRFRALYPALKTLG